MTRQFLLGDGAPCDLDRLVDTRLLIQGNSGAGKSFVVRRILEQTFGNVQHLVIDPEGEFSTLREKFDYVLAAPNGGDTVAHPRSAALLCERLLECRASAILDIFELKPADRVVFVKNFLEALIDAPKKFWHPILVIVDEAQRFCPERGTGEAESSDVMQRVATQGRKRGFCLIPAVQRLSMFHKSVAAECNNKLIGRTTLDDDVKRAAKELGLPEKEALAMLRVLDPEKGEWYAYGPALAQVPRRVFVGPVVTSHPKAGARAAFKPPPPSAAVLALLPQLADLPAEADARAKSIEDLKKDNARLQRELLTAKKEHPAPVAPEPKVVEVSVFDEADREVLREYAEVLEETRKLFEEQSGDIVDLIEKATSKVTPAPVMQHARRTTMPFTRVAPAKKEPLRPRGETPNNGDSSLTGPERRILNALAWLEAVGNAQPEETAVAFLAGYTVGGGAWGNPKSRLRARGLIAASGGAMSLTDEGRSLAETPNIELTNDAMQRAVKERLEGPHIRILDPLLAAYPDSLSNEDLAAAAGYEPNGGAYGNPRSRLRVLGLIEKRGDGSFAARDILFPEGA